MSTDTAAQPFQICGSCRRPWQTWEDFVLDPKVRLLGLQAAVTLPDVSLLVFEHSCGSSVSILTKRLRHLLPDPGPGASYPSLRGTEQCGGHCLLLEDLAACDKPCSNARDRDLIKLVQRLRDGHRTPASRAATD